MNINKSNIANAIHSVAKDHVVAVANDIYDESREQYQSTLNEGVGLYEDNPEFVEVKTDSEGKILYGVKADGDFMFGCGIPSQIQEKLDELGIYEDTPEYVRVYLDKEGKILWGIKTDGSIQYGAGVPSQIKQYIDERIQDLPLDEYEAIVNFIGDLVDSGTLQELLDAKVDKEEGKSLIDAEYASRVYQIESPEFIEVKLDEQERIIEATQKNRTKLFGADIRVEGDIENKGAIITTINNPEFIAVWVTSDNKFLFGIQNDGNFLFGCGIPSQITSIVGTTNEKIAALEQYMKETYGEMIESPEWLKVLADADDKVIEGIKVDGTKEVNTDVTLNGSLNHQGVVTEVTDNPEFLEAKIDSEGRFIEGINRNGEKVFGAIPPQIKQYIDENMPIGGSGIQSIEYDDDTGDMYATYDDESGVTDVSMAPNGDIYVEYETGV